MWLNLNLQNSNLFKVFFAFLSLGMKSFTWKEEQVGWVKATDGSHQLIQSSLGIHRYFVSQV